MFALLVWTLFAINASAASSQEQIALSFEQALLRLNKSSPALAASQEQHHSKETLARSLNSLDFPEVYVEGMGYETQKTLGVQHTSLNQLVINGVDVGNVSGSSMKLNKLVTSQNGVRAALTASWALYSGGKIPALQKGALAQAKQAEAMTSVTRDTLVLTLVQIYFGQQLAHKVVGLRKDLMAGLREHLDHAKKLEHNGMISRAQRLQAQVAYDTAIRAHEAARHDLENMQIALRNLLNLPYAIEASSPIFVLLKPLDGQEFFLEEALMANPKLQAISFLEEAAKEQIKAKRAELLPTVFLYGQYSLNRSGELLTDPDWIVGLGMKWTIAGQVDRGLMVKSATHEALVARYALEDARLQITTQLSQAYDGLESARKQFELTESSLAFAQENLRVQEVSFREGTGASTDVTDAKISLNNVLVDRVAAAYQFDVQLAQLLHASGQIGNFAAYMYRNDKVEP